MAYSMLSLQLQKTFFIFVSVIFIVVSVSTSHTLSIKNSPLTNSSSKKDGLVLNLIHRDLIVQPTYAPNSTLLDQIDLLLSGDAPSSDYDPNGVSMGFRGGNFFLEMGIGSKSVRQYVAFSTVTPFLWVQCAQGKSRGDNPVFDPTDSTSFRESTCLPEGGGRYCNRVPGEEGRSGGRCDSHNRCEYTLRYTDGSSSKGFVGFDRILFHDAHHGTSYVPNVLIGCGEGGERLQAHENGVFGLGGVRELSILDNLSKRFSFCIGSLSQPHSAHNHLALGEDAQLRGVPVPFTFLKGFLYQISVYRIALGRETITTNELKFTIDTMSKFSYVNRDIHNLIRGKVEQAVGQKMRKVIVKKHPDALCYTAPKLIHPFPELVLNLYHHTIQLDINSLFLKASEKNAFCLTIFASSTDNMIGTAALQHHNVGFDWTNQRAYFQKTDCSRIHQY